MATKDLEEKYKKLLEENSQYEQVIGLLKERLVFLDKEKAKAERKIEEQIRVPHIARMERNTCLKERETQAFRNLEVETKKLNDLKQRKFDSKESANQLKSRQNQSKTEEELDQLLAEQQATLAELEFGISDALKEKSMAEARMLKMMKNFEKDKLKFTKEKKKLRRKDEEWAKLQAFFEKKLQITIPAEDKNKTDILEQQEPNMLSSSDLVGATGMDPKKMSLTSTQNKKTKSRRTKRIKALEGKRDMLEERSIKPKGDILMLEQEKESLNCQPEDLDAEMENLTEMADSLDEKEEHAQKTLNELAAGISGLLKDIQKPADVTSDNIIDCLDILEESIDNLLIQANREEDLLNLSLPNDNLLPETPAEEMKNE